MHSPVPRVAAIHDLSGFGRTSLTVAIPIFSTMGIQVCPLPTAVLSTHTTEFTNFRFVDLTDSMPGFLAHWQELGLRFEAVYSGFLGSAAQVDIVVVVGGRNSGNTRRLVEVASAHGTPALHVEQASDLQPESFAGFSTVGLTAGASTPERHIAEVEARLLTF